MISNLNICCDLEFVKRGWGMEGLTFNVWIGQNWLAISCYKNLFWLPVFQNVSTDPVKWHIISTDNLWSFYMFLLTQETPDNNTKSTTKVGTHFGHWHFQLFSRKVRWMSSCKNKYFFSHSSNLFYI